MIPEELAVGPLVIPQSPTWNDDLRCFHKTVHPRKLTWIPKIAIVERKYNLKPFIFGTVSMLDFEGVPAQKNLEKNLVGPQQDGRKVFRFQPSI